MNMGRYALRMLIAAAAATALLTANAGAQMNPMMPKFSVGNGEKKKLTPEEQARQDQLDSAYDAATKKIPDQKTANDPWADVRSAPATSSSKKQQ